MSTLTAPPKASFAHAFHAEWVKFRSLRSTWYTLAGLFVIGLGITALSWARSERSTRPPGPRSGRRGTRPPAA